jgi:hypothetical protein
MSDMIAKSRPRAINRYHVKNSCSLHRRLLHSLKSYLIGLTRYLSLSSPLFPNRLLSTSFIQVLVFGPNVTPNQCEIEKEKENQRRKSRDRELATVQE